MPAIHCGAVKPASTAVRLVRMPTATRAVAPQPMPTARNPSALDRSMNRRDHTARRSSSRCAGRSTTSCRSRSLFPPPRSIAAGTCCRRTRARCGFEFLVGPLAPGAKINFADELVAPDVLRAYLTNWPDVVRYFIRSVEADAMADGTAETAALLERLIRYKGVSAVLRTRAADLAAATAGPVLPMRFRKGAIALELFTTIATLVTLQDITLQKLRIKSFFPMDADTARVLRTWARLKRTRARQGGPRSGQPQMGQL
jgi:hypothetical protein